MTTEIQLSKVNAEINAQLADKAVERALLATTFNGLEVTQMKKAILEGHLRGYTFVDFLKKDVYAVPFGQGYALVESIGRSRKIGAKSGINGKSAPTFVMADDGKKILSCSVTVYKRGGHPAGYTATVDFDEYVSAKPIWKSKPKTMISKVAEQHALRMACPEELSLSYIEEEFDHAAEVGIDTEELKEGAPTMGALLVRNDSHDKTKSKKDGPQAALDFGVAGDTAENKDHAA